MYGEGLGDGFVAGGLYGGGLVAGGLYGGGFVAGGLYGGGLVAGDGLDGGGLDGGGLEGGGLDGGGLDVDLVVDESAVEESVFLFFVALVSVDFFSSVSSFLLLETRKYTSRPIGGVDRSTNQSTAMTPRATTAPMIMNRFFLDLPLEGCATAPSSESGMAVMGLCFYCFIKKTLPVGSPWYRSLGK